MTAAPEIAVVIPFGAGFHTDALRSFDSGRCKCLVDPMAAQENPTLSAVLEEHSILFPPTSIPHLDTKITSFARFDDDLEFVIASYLDNPKNELQAPLLLTRYNKITGKWDYMPYSESRLKVSDISDKSGIPCLGSVTSVQKRAKWYFLALHLEPFCRMHELFSTPISRLKTLARVGFPPRFNRD
jgi:hypothetical protein